MTDKTLPIELVHKCLALVQKTHETLSPRILPKMIASKRNAVAVMMLPEASVILRAATSSFRIRVCLWIFAGAAVVVSSLVTWWLLLLTATAAVLERVIATRERRFWILLAAMLLSAEILASDFAGWGTAHPRARQAAAQALASALSADASLKWLDYYLPRRAEIGAEVVNAFGPASGARPIH